MLNRLYIVVGVLAILLLAAAFVAPLFIPWAQFRPQVEALASNVAGEPVTVTGEIGFTLLPQPRLTLTQVSVGPPGAPIASAEGVAADFSLIDFLRDHYVITRLQLDRPVIDLGFDGDDRLLPAVGFVPGGKPSSFSVANAEISDGTLKLSDQRSGKAITAEHVTGSIKLDAAGGPFAFQGSGAYDGRTYSARLTTSAMAEDGTAAVAVTVHPDDNGFSLSAQGTVKPGEVPSYAGELTYRQPPPPAPQGETQDAGQGDFVITAKFEATPTHLLLSDYLAIPDENRPATRLTGAAEVALGARPAFNAVVSGGVLSQPARDVTAEQGAQPYELVRFLRELPAPPAIGIPGTVGIDISELNLRAASLHNLRVDASVGPDGWQISRLTAQLAGDSTLNLSGTLKTVKGRPEFSGKLAVDSRRLDGLVAQWRKPVAGNPLFGMAGGLDASVAVVGETLSLASGHLTLDGQSRGFSAQVGFGGTRDLHLNVDLGELDADQSAALFALLPDPGLDPSFAATFPKGEFGIVADSVVIGGMTGRALSATGSWDGGVLVVDDVSAGDLGGARLKANLTAFGSFDKPELSGDGTLTINSPDAPALKAFYDAVGAPDQVRQFLTASFPADLALRLEAPSGNGAQSLSVAGTLGPSDLQADAQLDAGFVKALTGHLKLRLDLKSADPDGMTAQLGLGTTTILGASGPLHLVGVVDGTLADSIETTALLEGGGDSLGFSGNVIVSDPTAVSGEGTVKVKLADPTQLLAYLGAEGLSPPGFTGGANVDFAVGRSVQLSNIDGESGGERFSGDLAVTQGSGAASVTGDIKAGKFDLDGLLRLLAGPAALLSSGGQVWPDGPIDMGSAKRTMTGRVHFTTTAVTSGGADLVTNLGGFLDWDATGTKIRGLSGTIGGGELGLELQICCSGPLQSKQVNGRLSLNGADLKSLLPAAASGALSGKIDAIGQFSGTGDSPRAIMSALTGQGTYTVKEFAIQGLDPGALTAATGLEGVLNMQPEDLTKVVEAKLGEGPFTSPSFTGSFTIAGGIARSPNVSIQGPGGQLFGSGTLALTDLKLGGEYTLTPTEVAKASLVDAASAKISTQLTGTLTAPGHTFDTSGLVDAVMAEAYQQEVVRLEKLKAEADARRKAAEEAAARQAAEEEAAKKAADEAAQKAAADAAARQAEERAAQKAAADAAAQGTTPSPPLDLNPGASP